MYMNFRTKHSIIYVALINGSDLYLGLYLLEENFILTNPEFLYASPTALDSTILFQMSSAVVKQYNRSSSARGADITHEVASIETNYIHVQIDDVSID
jgi:hypothetical protein